MDNTQKIKTLKVILNKASGLFDYSPQFYKKYKEVYKEDFIFSNQKDLQFRTDEKIIKIFELLGSHKSSGFISELKIDYIPRDLLDYCKIVNVNGYESLRINYNKAYSEILFDIIRSNSISEINKNKITKIRYIEKNFSKKRYELFDFVN